MGWWKPYNVSGTILIGNRLTTMCTLLRELLKTDQVERVEHFTGATTIACQSEIAEFISTGFERHEFYAHVFGIEVCWKRFAEDLEGGFLFANFPYSIVVHDQIINEKKEE